MQPEQLSPGFLAHAQEGLTPSTAPFPRSADTPTGAAVGPAPSPSPTRTEQSPPPPPLQAACRLASLLGFLPPCTAGGGGAASATIKGCSRFRDSGWPLHAGTHKQPLCPAACSWFIGSGAHRDGRGCPPASSSSSSWPGSHPGRELWCRSSSARLVAPSWPAPRCFPQVAREHGQGQQQTPTACPFAGTCPRSWVPVRPRCEI